MANYTTNKKVSGLDVLNDLSQNDLHLIGDTSDAGKAKSITEDNLEIHIANSNTFINELTQNATFITNVNTLAPNPLTTKGDIYTRSGTTAARLPVGTNGQILSVDSTETTGLKWVDQSFGGGGGSGGVKLAIDTTQVLISGGGVETVLYTIPIPAGTLGTNNAIRFRILLNFSGSDFNSSVIKAKYGGITIATATSSRTSSIFTWVEGVIIADNATNVQKGQVQFVQDSATTGATPYFGYGTSAVDSNSSQDLVITLTINNTNVSAAAESIIVEKIIGSPSVSTYISTPVLMVTDINSNAYQFNDNTKMKLFAINVPNTINVSKMSVDVDTVGTGGTLSYAVYSEDGQKLLINETTGIISSLGINTTTIAQKTLEPGNYYIGIHSNSSTNISLIAYDLNGGRNFTPLGESVLAGTITIAASTTPATIDPTIITEANTSGLVTVRFDS